MRKRVFYLLVPTLLIGIFIGYMIGWKIDLLINRKISLYLRKCSEHKFNKCIFTNGCLFYSLFLELNRHE